MTSVTVVIPSVGRAEQLDACLGQLLRTAPNIEIVAVLDPEDSDSVRVAQKHKAVKIVDQNPDELAIPAWNRGAAASTGDYLVTGADDVWFHDGWLEEALRVMAGIRNYGMVGLNSLDKFDGALATHYMVSRPYAVNEWGGILFFPQYQHFFSDNEANERARRDGCYAWARKAVVEHRHWVYNKAKKDHIYDRTDDLYRADQKLFHDRMAMGFPNNHKPSFDILREPSEGWGKVALAERIYKSPEPDYHKSWTRLIAGGLRKGDTIFDPVIGKPGHVAANMLARAFLASSCDSLLLLDDDMTFEGDALEKLRSNPDTQDHDMVFGFCTHRNIPPHAVVMRKMIPQPPLPESLLGEHYGTLKNIEDNAVIDVDAVGLAFTLIKRHVFEKMLNEYGALYTSWFDWGAHTEGEDVVFSRRCRQHGFSIAVDTNVKLGHVGRYTYTWDDHQRWLDQENQNG